MAWQLSGGQCHVTDFSNASRTLLMDRASGQWSPKMLQLLNIPPACLPRIVPSQGVIGEARIGNTLIPLAGMAGDQQAALFGQACFTPGMAKNTYGTGCFLLMNCGHATDRLAQPATEHGRLATARIRPPGNPHRPAPVVMRRRAAATTPSKAPSSSAAPWSSGCATTSS